MATVGNSLLQLQPRRGISLRLRRRRSLPTVRLGGERPRRGGLLLRSSWRRMRLKWLKMKYQIMLRRMKEYYHKLIKEIVEASAYTEAFQQRVLMEAACAVPVMAGVNFTSFRSDSRAMPVIM
ncbi:uncharacterized protein LOC116198757 [Punica granatum]|uniref:Uncharacterized protein LOC116198757 n=2 Tax=Punica granatum TaxID=22663 RepID=A0A6P8CZP7_PUNGR|nr:uncharacterized protein LOC116198757 [Punica granatum]PKI43777.1 hypothetical protein CRG98_035788 [Punica granatum]